MEKLIKKILREGPICGDKTGDACGNCGDGYVWTDSYVTNSCICNHSNGAVCHSTGSGMYSNDDDVIALDDLYTLDGLKNKGKGDKAIDSLRHVKLESKYKKTTNMKRNIKEAEMTMGPKKQCDTCSDCGGGSTQYPCAYYTCTPSGACVDKGSYPKPRRMKRPSFKTKELKLENLIRKTLRETVKELNEAPNCYYRRRNYANSGYTCVARKCGFRAHPRAFYPGEFSSMNDCNGSMTPVGPGGPGNPGNFVDDMAMDVDNFMPDGELMRGSDRMNTRKFS